MFRLIIVDIIIRDMSYPVLQNKALAYFGPRKYLEAVTGSSD
jgi:hypothetical protein